MKRISKVLLGLVLAAAMMLRVTSTASASTSIQVNGHIEESGKPADKHQMYHITYHANGGTGGYDGPDITAGETATVSALSGTGIARSGYKFLKWNTSANGSGTSYAPGDTVTLNTDLTLYAQWEKETAGTEAPKTGTGKGTASGILKTGDTAGIFFWAGLIAVSLSGMAFLFWIYRRKKQHDLRES